MAVSMAFEKRASAMESNHNDHCLLFIHNDGVGVGEMKWRSLGVVLWLTPSLTRRHQSISYTLQNTQASEV